MRHLLPAMLFAFVACAGPVPEEEPGADSDGVVATAAVSLDSILSCNDRAVGGDALRSITAVEYDLRIEEPTFQVDGTYRAERAGETARIDIYAEGERVFSEGWDGQTGWQWPGNAEAPEPTSPEGGAALLHGLQQPGHFWTLKDMAPHGHDVERVPELDDQIGGDSWALRVTLTDGFEVWYWVDRQNCRIVGRRDFRAFHPDMDSTRTWIETLHADFRRTNGIERGWLTVNVDRVTGDTIGTTTLEAVRIER